MASNKILVGVITALTIALLAAVPRLWMTASTGEVERAARAYTDERAGKLIDKVTELQVQIAVTGSSVRVAVLEEQAKSLKELNDRLDRINGTLAGVDARLKVIESKLSR